MKIQNFMCFKNTDKVEGSKEPDYRLSARIGEVGNDKFVDIGAGWIKDGKNGKFISFTLREPYQEKDGFVIEVVPATQEDDIGF